MPMPPRDDGSSGHCIRCSAPDLHHTQTNMLRVSDHDEVGARTVSRPTVFLAVFPVLGTLSEALQKWSSNCTTVANATLAHLIGPVFDRIAGSLVDAFCQTCRTSLWLSSTLGSSVIASPSPGVVPSGGICLPQPVSGWAGGYASGLLERLN